MVTIQDKKYNEDFQTLKGNCKTKKVALQLIKTICKGPWPEGSEQIYNTWYEPLTEQEDINTAIGWALKQDNAFINSAADVTLLAKIIKAAELKKEISASQIQKMALDLGISNLF